MLDAEDSEELGVMGGEEDVEGVEELLMRYSKVSWPVVDSAGNQDSKSR